MADSGQRPNRPRFATRVIHAGQSPDPTTGAVMPPIYATSTYVQESPGVHKGYEYSRSQNPTRMAYERCIADLESGTAGFAFASGMAATATILDLLDSGSHVVAIDDLYGGSYRLFENVRRDSAGLAFSFVDLTEPGALEAALRPETRMIWVESPTNPLLKVVDLEAVARTAGARGILTCCDNTFATPWVQRPLELGFDGHQIPQRPLRHGGRHRRGRRPAGDQGAPRLPAERRRRHTGAFRFVPGTARLEDAGFTHGAPLRQCPGRCRVSRGPRQDRAGLLPGPGEPPAARIGSTADWQHGRCGTSAAW
jgi:hypothetical protein